MERGWRYRDKKRVRLTAHPNPAAAQSSKLATEENHTWRGLGVLSPMRPSRPVTQTYCFVSSSCHPANVVGKVVTAPAYERNTSLGSSHSHFLDNAEKIMYLFSYRFPNNVFHLCCSFKIHPIDSLGWLNVVAPLAMKPIINQHQCSVKNSIKEDGFLSLKVHSYWRHR